MLPARNMRVHPPAFVTLAAVIIGLLLLGSVGGLRAQAPAGPDTTESTTEDSTGIVLSVAPYRTITVDSRRGPFTYRLGQDLHIIGPDSHPLKIRQVAEGDKVTVFYYIRDGQQTVARIVVLHHGKNAAK